MSFLKRFFFTCIYFFYDFIRYLVYSRSLRYFRLNVSDYSLIKTYHSLEKSLSFKDRNIYSGWGAAEKLFRILILRAKINNNNNNDLIAANVLYEYTMCSKTKNKRLKHEISMFLQKEFELAGNTPICKSGILPLTSDFARKGQMDNPEDFFFSRHSIREFKNEIVEDEVIYKALTLASKTPSVCNRQPWFTYHIVDKSLIQRLLKLQNGNAGFTDEIHNLFVIAIDVSAFESEIERFQPWIDGGLYSMSLCYALHSLGVGSCFLNLDIPPHRDLRLRKLLNAPWKHTFISMLAFGYIPESLKVCSSERFDFFNYYKKL